LDGGFFNPITLANNLSEIDENFYVNPELFFNSGNYNLFLKTGAIDQNLIISDITNIQSIFTSTD
tara:strand:- start:403 stop:597 length:195 start_codon:yes stop_codon:yes gene_type:complete